jgi:hypothetical protein
MPAFVTPSLARQRIILVAFFAVIGVASWWQNTGNNSAYPVQKFPLTSLPDDFDALDFTNAEAAWSGLTLDAQGNLQIDALTESALIDAIALMQDETSDPAKRRMTFLLEKQFGTTASRQIMELLPILKNYKEAEQRWLQENGSKDPPRHAELFQLQDKLLGETLARKMFAEQRRLTNLMLATHQIRNDASLTRAEKDEALRRLQNTVDGEGASVE